MADLRVAERCRRLRHADDEPRERERERDEPEVVPRLGRIRAVLPIVEDPARPVSEDEVSGRGKQKLEGSDAVHVEVVRDAMEAGAPLRSRR